MAKTVYATDDIPTAANFNAFTQEANAAITGGTINGAAIGGTTPAAGSFTTLTASGAATMAGIDATGTVAVTGALRAGDGTDFLTTARQTAGDVRIAVNRTGYVSGNPYAGIDFAASGSSGGQLIFSTMASAGALTIKMVLSETGTLKTTSTISVGNATPSASGAGITFPATVSASTDVNTLDDYDEYTAASAACTGAITTAAVWKLTKVGNMVTLTLPAVLGTASGTGYYVRFGTAVPAKYRPAVNTLFASARIFENNTGLAAPGAILVDSSTGEITIYKELTASVNWSATANCGSPAATAVSWTI